jgi:hypothetical protein
MILNDYVRELADGKDIPEQTLDFAVSFYHYAISGCLSEWYRTGMRETPDEIISQFILMFEGLALIIERAADKEDE